MSRFGISISSVLSELGRVRTLVDGFAVAFQLSSDVAADVQVALDEVLTNIIKYGYTDNLAHRIHIQLGIERNALVAEIEDDGVAFNPLDVSAPDLKAPLSERRVGGVGIHFVRNLMSEVRYDRVGDRNRLVLKKKLTA